MQVSISLLLKRHFFQGQQGQNLRNWTCSYRQKWQYFLHYELLKYNCSIKYTVYYILHSANVLKVTLCANSQPFLRKLISDFKQYIFCPPGIFCDQNKFCQLDVFWHQDIFLTRVYLDTYRCWSHNCVWILLYLIKIVNYFSIF